jgi:uncharacterized protein (TIGR02246 family)
MNRTAGLIIMTTCLSIPLAARGQGKPASQAASQVLVVERQIQPLMDSMMVAANAHDTDRFLASYLHDSSLVLVFNGVITEGFDDVRALQLKWWNNGKSDVVYSQDGTAHFTVLDPDAAVVTTMMSSQRASANGTVVAGSAGRFAVTAVWQKRPEGWRIVQTHESTAH